MGQSGEWGEDNILYSHQLTGNEVLYFSSNSNSSILLLLRQSNTSQHCGTPSIHLRLNVFSELFFIQLTTYASNSTQSSSVKVTKCTTYNHHKVIMTRPHIHKLTSYNKIRNNHWNVLHHTSQVTEV